MKNLFVLSLTLCACFATFCYTPPVEYPDEKSNKNDNSKAIWQKIVKTQKKRRKQNKQRFSSPGYRYQQHLIQKYFTPSSSQESSPDDYFHYQPLL